MSKPNCINCGAAKEVTEIKCPFCGTVYIDMTTIDFYGRTPVILKLQGPGKSKPVIVKAIPTMGRFDINYNTVGYELPGTLGMGRYIHRANPDIDINIDFKGLEVIEKKGGA